GLGRVLITQAIADRTHSTLDAAPDATLLAFNFGIALAASIGFGLAPALQSARSNLVHGLKGAHSDAGRLTGRKLMLSVQIAISLALLAGAGLFVRSVL